jgi:hypothetical protein
MAETRKKFDQDFEEAVRLVRETGKPVRRWPGLGDQRGTLGNCVNTARRRRGAGDGALDENERGGADPAAEGECRPPGSSQWSGVRSTPSATANHPSAGERLGPGPDHRP